ncbi:MAG TPA: exodeoxyribonuclease VII large subunit, partial [Spirochaetia bacterium]|nr:exodeoxyribonuclease VII large subunit [Spirochaetia bacterium]
QAVLFRGRASRLDFAPADGMLVRAEGSLSVYAARGQYQLVCENLVRAGQGDILALLEERRRRLAAEGLFDPDRKRPLPRFPETVAVVTSPTGAAIRDILNVLGRRNAGIRVIVLPAAVQGADAPVEIARQIRTANRYRMAEVLIVGRGGGSLEDLLAFSDEEVVRAVAESEIPVISAVGHEIDWALTDFAADLRAPTPSAAAELVSESRGRLAETAASLGSSMAEEVRRRLERTRAVINQFDPESLELRFRRVLQPRLQRFDDLKEDLVLGMRDSLVRSRHRFDLASLSLASASPQAVLSRGFAVVRSADTGRAVRDSRELSPRDRVTLQFARGASAAVIEESEP